MTDPEFIETILLNPVNAAILKRLPALAVPDAWLVSGALFQTVWNVRTARDVQYGIKDYDIFYFDPDVSWEAEDAVIKRAVNLFGDLNVPVQVRNQARVHLWYEQKFGKPYPPLSRTTDGIDRFLMDCAMVGIRPNRAGYDLYAPNGLTDVVAMTIRPNRTANFHIRLYLEKARSWHALWPELTVLPA